jgi:hypothetical protein
MREIAIKFHTNPEVFPNLCRICLPADWNNYFLMYFYPSGDCPHTGLSGADYWFFNFVPGTIFMNLNKKILV